MTKSFLACVAVAVFMGTSVFAGPQPVGMNEPVVLGQWHSNLEAAKAKALETGAPLLVVFSLVGCSICANFDASLSSEAAKSYLATRGLVMVYQKAPGATAISSWAGPHGETKVPLVRITWFDGTLTSYKADLNWYRPGTFDAFRSKIESKVGSYVYDPTSADQSKDAFDPGNDLSSGAALLAWSDQVKSESLKLAKKTDTPAYTDFSDWFKLAVETGKTYKVYSSKVSGVATDQPKMAVYGDAAGADVVAGPEALGSTGFEFTRPSPGFVYVKVWRTTGNDANIQYTLSYQRSAQGHIAFTQTTALVKEDSPNVTLTLARTGGTAGVVSVKVGFVGSETAASAYTATAGQDFIAAEQVITWADGDAQNKSVIIGLNKNGKLWEGDETFAVTLSPVNAPGVTVGQNAVVTIQEADPARLTAGRYEGWIGSIYTNGPEATISMTVSEAGGLTGKVVFPTGAAPYSGTYTFSSMQLSDISKGIASVSGSLVKLGGTPVPLTLKVTLADGTSGGSIGVGENEKPVALFLDQWANPDRVEIANDYAGYYTVAFPVRTPWPGNAPAGNGYATITLDKKGRFKASGKLGDGTAWAQSGVLFIGGDSEGAQKVCALLFAVPKAYAGGRFAGVLCFDDANTNGIPEISLFDSSVFVWSSLNPASMPEYDVESPGFESTLEPVGGWYNKLLNLSSYYKNKVLSVGDLAEPPELDYTLTVKERKDGRVVSSNSVEQAAAASWQAVTNALTITPKTDGSGFTVPRADLKLLGKNENGSPLYNYDVAVNPNGLNLQFNRATGLMSGKYNVYYDYASVQDSTGATVKTTWKHTAKSVAYQCVLLPERPSLQDGVEGRGYCLFADQGLYDSATGVRSYTFNHSFEFLMNVE